MARHFRYFAGNFESQFTTVNKRELSSFTSHSRIQPEQRFILSEISEISPEDYEGAVNSRSGKHIYLELPSEIELRYSDRQAELDTCEGLLISENPDRAFIQFIATKDHQQHGRLEGKAVCRVFSHETKEPELKLQETTPPEPALQTLTGSGISSGSASTGPTLPDISPPATGKGCLPALLPGTSENSGCMPLGQPGCRQWGCGIVGLLFLLAMLAGLLRACMEQAGNAPAPQVIHDTVYVQVEKVDTVKVLRIDTLVLVDSVRQMEYKTVTLPNVNFFTSSAKLTPSSISDIQKIAEYLNDNPEMTAVVIGHTDSIGNARKNQELSQKRAESVRNMIVTLGVDEARVTAVGKGEAEPRADNSTEEGRLMNRRVEVQLVNSTKVNGGSKSKSRKP